MSPVEEHNKQNSATAIVDVIVIGLGVMGASSCFQLASRNLTVIGLEQADCIAHDLSSSNGESRIIRESNFEDVRYLPLVRRSFEIVRDLESRTHKTGELLHVTGSLCIGPTNGFLISGVVDCCIANNIAHAVLDAAAVRDQFPAFRGVPDNFSGHFEPGGGFLDSSKTVLAFAEAARANGATLRTGTKVIRHSKRPDEVIEVETNTGEILLTRKLVISAGAWTNTVVPELAAAVKSATITPERQVLAWFEPKSSAGSDESIFALGKCPVFIVEDDENYAYYGFPEYQRSGVKIGRFRHLKQIVDPDQSTDWKDVTSEDVDAIGALVGKYMPDATVESSHTKTCMFSNTIDMTFIVDRLPGNDDVIVACGFSGHGFKFSAYIGQMVADLVEDKDRMLSAAVEPLLKTAKEVFSLARFAKTN